MQDFCNEVIEQIKTAQTEHELSQVINNSFRSLRRKRNSFNEAGYMIHMIVSLRAARAEASPTTTSASNMKLAVAIFQQLQKDRRVQVF
jgi:hypothetical protein